MDVREANEWEEGHAPGAVHIPLSALTGVSAPEGQPLLTICRSGRRSAQACAGLTAAGRNAINVTGGMVAWRDAGLPVLTDEGAPGAIA